MSESKAGQPGTATPATNGVAPWLDEYNDLIPEVDLDELVTEDGKPVDNVYVERLYKLLTEALYASWRPPGEPNRPFVALTNVGWFHLPNVPALAPDVLVSLDVTPRHPGTREGRSYFEWILQKQPDVVIEVVSDDRADEPGEKLRQYERWSLPYHVIHDPFGAYDGGVIRAFELRGGKFAAIDHRWLENVGLGLVMWDGAYEGYTWSWLRWCDREGHVLPTAQEHREQEKGNADRLRAQLRKLGVEPEV